MALFFSTILLFLSFMTLAAAQQTVRVAVPQGLADRYESILKQQNKQATELTNLDIKQSNRGFASLVILNQALDKGGLPAKFEFTISPNTKRSQLLLQSGDAVLTQQLLFAEDVPRLTRKSSAVVESGVYIKGIYGLQSNQELMKVKTLDALKKHTAVTVAAWTGDVNALKKISPAQLDLLPSYSSLFRRIAYRDTGFTLLDFSTLEQLKRVHQDITLVPVPGVAIGFPGTLHFIVSQSHPDSQRVFQALEKGLKIMREQGLIKKYYEQVKAFRTDLQDWKILNQPK